MGRPKGSKNIKFTESGSVIIDGKEYIPSIDERGTDGKFPESDASFQEDESLIGEPKSTCWNNAD